jgi:hypothetical protein
MSELLSLTHPAGDRRGRRASSLASAPPCRRRPEDPNRHSTTGRSRPDCGTRRRAANCRNPAETLWRDAPADGPRRWSRRRAAGAVGWQATRSHCRCKGPSPRKTGQNSPTSFTRAPASRRRHGPDASAPDASPDRVRYAGVRRCPSLSSCTPLQRYEHDSVNHISRATNPTAPAAGHCGPSGRDARTESIIDLPTHLDRSTCADPNWAQCPILS